MNDQDEHLSKFITMLVSKENNQVRFSSLPDLHAFLKNNGVKLSWKEDYGPKGGRQLYYHSGGFRASGIGVVIRVKTHGEAAGKHRAFKPHMSIVLQKGVSGYNNNDAKIQGKEDFDRHEKGKFSAAGSLESKSPTGDEAQKLSWANRTHFMFPGFENSDEKNPIGLHGAEALNIDGKSA